MSEPITYYRPLPMRSLLSCPWCLRPRYNNSRCETCGAERPMLLFRRGCSIPKHWKKLLT